MKATLNNGGSHTSNDMGHREEENSNLWADPPELDASKTPLLSSKVPTTDIPNIQLFEKIHQLNQRRNSTSLRKHLAFVTCVASLEMK